MAEEVVAKMMTGLVINLTVVNMTAVSLAVKLAGYNFSNNL